FPGETLPVQSPSVCHTDEAPLQHVFHTELCCVTVCQHYGQFKETFMLLKIGWRQEKKEVTEKWNREQDIDTVKSYKYLGVHLNDSLDWSDNTDALVKKGNSRLFLLRRLRSFGVQGPLLRTFYDSVVASAIFYGIVCWASSITDRDRRRMDRLVRRASSVLGCPLDSVEVVGNGRMMAKLSSLLNNTSHPLQDTLTALGSSFSERLLLHPRCVKERYRRSFLPAAVRLYNNKQNALLGRGGSWGVLLLNQDYYKLDCNQRDG
ncbi:hypothetical protein L3Q82_026817, partial [Scortum barcoo]